MTTAEAALWQASLDLARATLQEFGAVSAALLAINPVTNEIAATPLAGLSKAETSHIINNISQLTPCATLVEAWFTTIDPTKQPETYKAALNGADAVTLQPSKSPDRKECLAVSLYHKTRHVLARATIHRDAEGKPTLDLEWDVLDNAAKSTTLRAVSYGDTSKQFLT